MKKKVLSQINALAKSIIASESDIDIIKTKHTLIQLYEKLTVLEFLKSSEETKFEKPKRSATDSKTYREQNWFQDPDPVPQPSHEDALVEPLMEKIKDLVAQMPSQNDPDGSAVEDLLKEILPKKETFKNDLEEFAASYQENLVFERKQEIDIEKETKSVKSAALRYLSKVDNVPRILNNTHDTQTSNNTLIFPCTTIHKTTPWHASPPSRVSPPCYVLSHPYLLREPMHSHLR